MITLAPEQARLLAETAQSPPRVVDPQTQQTYFLVSGEVYARAQALLEEEQDVLGMYPLVGELDKNQRGELTDREREALSGLRAEADRLLLQRSYAYLLLKYRGHQIPNLGDLKR